MKYLYNKTFVTHGENETFLLAGKLTKVLPLGSVVLLFGDLGSGKTTFVKGVANSLNIKDKVQSPTFNIMKIYLDGNTPLVHIDAYRLEDNNADIGLDEYIGVENGYTFIEWPTFINSLIDYNNAVVINFIRKNEYNREITISSNLNFLREDL